MPEPTTATLDLPGVTLCYDVRGDLRERPVLFLIGSPMGAGGFPSLASHFADRTVLTYDPRGVDRSVRSDGTGELRPEQHAADLHALIAELDVAPVDLFATSGGAVNALALVAAHPDDVRVLVAHEPPLAELLPDRQQALAASDDVHQTYLRQGLGPAMAKFIALVSFEGPLPADYRDRPAPDPAVFGLPTTDDGSRDDVLCGQNIRGCTGYRPDLAALRSAPTRVVPAAGQSSGGQLAARAAHRLAEMLGLETVAFPGDHAGFLGGEYGQQGEPEAFAARLREVLAAGDPVDSPAPRSTG